jgi:hypothetical protein
MKIAIIDDAANRNGRKATMVTVNERLMQEQIDLRSGLLSEWVEQDMADVLTEFGARMEDAAPERVRHIPPPSLAYGIPMAGVRYYTYVPER